MVALTTPPVAPNAARPTAAPMMALPSHTTPRPGSTLGTEEIGEATRLLQRYAAGEPDAANHLLDLIYGELRALANRFMADERANHTLQPTALVNEAFLRLIRQPDGGFQNRDHFLRMAARAMRFVLVDHARARNSDKRGSGRQSEPLDHALLTFEDRGADLLALGDALARLEEIDPQAVRVVELRFFGGNTIAETARLLDVSHGTVENHWKIARIWLAHDLAENEDVGER